MKIFNILTIFCFIFVGNSILAQKPNFGNSVLNFNVGSEFNFINPNNSNQDFSNKTGYCFSTTLHYYMKNSRFFSSIGLGFIQVNYENTLKGLIGRDDIDPIFGIINDGSYIVNVDKNKYLSFPLQMGYGIKSNKYVYLFKSGFQLDWLVKQNHSALLFEGNNELPINFRSQEYQSIIFYWVSSFTFGKKINKNLSLNISPNFGINLNSIDKNSNLNRLFIGLRLGISLN